MAASSLMLVVSSRAHRVAFLVCCGGIGGDICVVIVVFAVVHHS